ncbi:MAG: lactate utilization protein [Synergistes sp.]|nr:lactate utilization protein [Synergistes sp.]
MDCNEAKDMSMASRCKFVCKALEANGFHAVFAADEETACAEAMRLIGSDASVGIPGTVTVREIGLVERLRKDGHKIYEHWDPNMSNEARRAAFMGELTADWFVTSANAVTTDGMIVNIDGTGNRVGAISWAPGKLLFIIGANKITADIHAAVARCRNTATPPNALRLSMDTPCAETGLCFDCRSPQRLCNVISILERPPRGRDCHVIMVGRELGY